jgi:hypothetical protein
MIGSRLQGKTHGLDITWVFQRLYFYSHTAGEYWERHGSMTHTDPRDGSDMKIPESARMYALAGAPHAAITADNPRWIGQLPPNNISPQPFLRACFVLMDRWASAGEPPPPSRIPKRPDGTLVPPEQALKHFRKIPRVNLPVGPSRCPYWNYGPEFDRGIMSVFPPEAVKGREYPIQVPQVDADGNDMGGVRYPDLQVPLGTTSAGHCARPDSPKMNCSPPTAASSLLRARRRSAKRRAIRGLL